MKHFTVILFCLLVAPVWGEQVCSVHDGDTFKLCNGQSIRVYGVDAPELKQPMGKDSRDYLKKLVLGQDVKLNCLSKSWNRQVCRVESRGQSVQREMAGRGWAFDSPQYSAGEFADAEAFAQKLGRGVWALPDGGVRPWEFRHR